MAKGLGKETSELEIRLKTEQAQQQLKELRTKQDEYNSALAAMGKDDAGRKEVAADLEKVKSEIISNEQEIVKLQSSLKRDIRVVINGDPAEATLNELIAAQVVLTREMKTFKDETDPIYIKKAEQLAAITARANELLTPIKQAKKEFIDLGQAGSLLRLETEVKQLNVELSKLTFGTDAYNKKLAEISGKEAAINKIKTSTIDAKNAMQSVDQVGSFNSLKIKVDALRTEIDTLTPGTKRFIEATKELQQAESRLNTLNKTIQGTSGFWAGLSQQVKQFGLLAAGYLGFSAITSQLTNIISKNAKLSDSLADLRRVAGLSAEEVQGLSKSLSDLNTRTGKQALLEIAIVAGKLGVAKDDLAGFTREVDKLAVALGDELGNADQITSTLGKILNVFDGKINAENIAHLGNVIVDLANKGVATGGFIADFTQRLSGIATAANLSLPATVGLGAGLEELGQKVESSATAVQKLIIKVGEDIPKAAKIAGAESAKEINEFADLFATKPEQALLKFAQGLLKNKATFAEVTAGFKDAGEEGARTVSTLTQMGLKADFLSSKIELAGKSIKETTAINEAFRLKNETLGAQLDQLGKAIFKAFSNSTVTSFLTQIVKGLNDLFGVSDKYIEKSSQVISSNRSQAATAQGLLAQYEALTKDGIKPTAEEKEKLKGITYQLRDALGDSIGKINEETGAFEINKAAVAEAIKQKILLANQEASTLALKANSFKEEIESGIARGKQLREELTARQDILKSFGLTETAAENYYKKLIEGGAAGDLLQKQLGKDQAEAISNYERTSALLAQNNNYIKDQGKEYQVVIDKLKDLGFTQKEITDLFKAPEVSAAASSKTPAAVTNTITDAEKAAHDKSLQEQEQYNQKIATLYEQLGTIESSLIKDETEKQLADLENKFVHEKDVIEKNVREINALEGVSPSQKKTATDTGKEALLKLEDSFQQNKTRIILESDQKRSDSELKQDEQNLKREHDSEINSLTDLLFTKQISKQEFSFRSAEIEKKSLAQQLALNKEYEQQELDNLELNSDARKAEFEKDFENKKAELDKKKLSQSEYKVEIEKLETELNSKVVTLDKGVAEVRISIHDKFAEKINGIEHNIADNTFKVEEDLQQKLLNVEKETLALKIKHTAEGTLENLALVEKQITDEQEVKAKAADDDLAATAESIQKTKEALATASGADQERLQKELADKVSLYDAEAAYRLAIDQETNDRIAAARQKHFEQLASIVQGYYAAFANVAAALNREAEAGDQKELKRDQKLHDDKKKHLDDQLKNELISQDEYNKQSEANDLDLDRKQAAIKKKAWERQHQIDVIQHTIDTALAIGKALAGGPPPFNLALAAITAAAEAIQTGIIIGQSPPEFKEGTTSIAKSFIAEGPSHAEKGIALVNSKTGEKLGEIEGNEAVIAADTTAKKIDVINDLIYNRGENVFVATASAKETQNINHSAKASVEMQYADGGILPDGSADFFRGLQALHFAKFNLETENISAASIIYQRKKETLIKNLTSITERYQKVIASDDVERTIQQNNTGADEKGIVRVTPGAGREINQSATNTDEKGIVRVTPGLRETNPEPAPNADQRGIVRVTPGAARIQKPIASDEVESTRSASQPQLSDEYINRLLNFYVPKQSATPKFLDSSAPIPQLNTERLVQNLQVQRFGYPAATGNFPESIQPPKTQAPNSSTAVTTDPFQQEMLKVLAKTNDLLDKNHAILNNPKPQKNYVLLQEFNTQQDLLNQTKKNAQVGS